MCDIRKSKIVELLFSLSQSVLFYCYNRINITDWVIYERNIFIFHIYPNQDVQYSSVIICNGPSCVTYGERRKRGDKSWNPQSPAL
jgi:hypothetical protein